MTAGHDLQSDERKTALYVQVPFCRARCAYCDFNTYAGIEPLIPAYVAAVCREIEAVGREWGPLVVPTVYFGGGTPSIVPPDLLAQVYHVVERTFGVPEDVEVTLEANPGTVTPAVLRGLLELGVNRLSLGAQSAHDDELQFLGRIHRWEQVLETVEAARVAGFDSLSLDFIFGLPGQTLARWRRTLEAALTLGPEHLSLYGLTIEEGTPLERSIAAGQVPPPDDDAAAEMYELAEDVLANAGYFHYEISNWARIGPRPQVRHLQAQTWWPSPAERDPMPDPRSEGVSPYVCRHNLTYWRNQSWFGVGAGAHSWWDGHRWANVRHPREYVVAVTQGDMTAVEVEAIDRRLEMGETMMLGLRLAEGVSDVRFRSRFGVGMEAVFAEQLADLQAVGLLEWDKRVARLTARGRLLGNQVFGAFV